MKRPFEQLLDECLSQLNSGVTDLETILARYPEEADRLRPLLRVARAVRETPQPVPSPAAKAVGRQRLLVAAARKRQQREAARRGMRRYLDELAAFLNWVGQSSQPVRRAAVLVVAVLMMMVVTGVGVTQVAARSLPDTPLYPIKLASERIQLALASSPAERARLHITFGERRLQEAQALARSGRPLNTALAEMVQQNKKVFGALTQVPEEERGPLLESLIALTQAERRALSQIKSSLSTSDQAAIAEALALSAEDQARAEEARRNPKLVELIPTSLPPTLTPFVPTATATLLPTATLTAAPVEVVPTVELPEKPPKLTATAMPTKTPAPGLTATRLPIGEQPSAVTPTVANTNTPVVPTPTPGEQKPPSVTPPIVETPNTPPSPPTVGPTNTPAIAEPTGPPPPLPVATATPAP